MRVLALIVLLVVAGCSDTPTSPTRVDGTWRIVSIRAASQAEQLAPVAALYQVTFENGQVSLRVDCNTCSGAYTASGNTLTLGPGLACTRAACSTAAFESAVVSLLSGEHQMTSTLHNLTLTSSRGTILLQR